MPGTVLGTGDSKILAFRELKSKVGVGGGAEGAENKQYEQAN